jgi:hypothetical protein
MLSQRRSQRIHIHCERRKYPRHASARLLDFSDWRDHTSVEVARHAFANVATDKSATMGSNGGMSIRAARGLETSLYDAVKSFLEAQGFEVKGEVCGCDIVAVRQGEPPVLVITELKMALSMELVLQGVERLRVADEVWLAVLATRRGRDRDHRAHRLCRLLGFGLLAVHPARNRVEILAEPAPYRPRPNLRQRRRLLKEHAARHGDPTRGGSTRQPIMTAYRQQALTCAAALQARPLRPRDLKRVAPDAGRILLRNVYGWFERIEPGLYGLAEAGAAALRRWAVIPGSARSFEDPTDARFQRCAGSAGSSVPPATTPS